MDPLSDVLRVVRLTGAYFYRVEATAPWSVSALHTRDFAPRVLPDSEHLIPYHIVTSGSCWAGLAGHPQVYLQAGDAFVLPHGDPHLLSSDHGQWAAEGAYGAAPGRYPATVVIGDGSQLDATFVCGFLGCDARPFNPLLAALPPVLHVAGAAGGWLGEFPRQVVAESRAGRLGAETLLTRMAELMFIEVVRRHLESLPAQERGWLAGLRDEVVGPALTCLHERPSHPWTLADVAHAVGASRSVLAERFTAVLGVPPMQYLQQWRLQLAAHLLSTTTEKVAAIGARVGYESEAAFSRAFKRAAGTSPAGYRTTRPCQPRSAPV